MHMKNQKTMYRLAKARAIREGPKTFMMISGFALTEAEIRDFYTREGFTSKTADKHLDLWKELEWVDVKPVGGKKENVFFFTLDDSDRDERMTHMALREKFSECTESLPGVMFA